ncbi:MAG: alpha-ketoglutarate-dependent dioxygenase AlkB [Pseudomonas fluorescens]|nr:MAG: alpha-ketoglutarate-dependent dioxygenase AlkB [Pseudomonas fluorescens]
MSQPSLFSLEEAPPIYPSGFRLMEDLITPQEEAALLATIQPLPFKHFEYEGYEGHRRVISYGWDYDFNTHTLHTAEPIPTFLHNLRTKAATFAEMNPEDLQQAIVTEYAPGAGIGWHRDRPMFEKIVGISLSAPCTFRLRLRTTQPAHTWARINLMAAPRSAYLISGESRTQWEHSIPPVEQLRYSITFRNYKP